MRQKKKLTRRYDSHLNKRYSEFMEQLQIESKQAQIQRSQQLTEIKESRDFRSQQTLALREAKELRIQKIIKEESMSKLNIVACWV